MTATMTSRSEWMRRLEDASREIILDDVWHLAAVRGVPLLRVTTVLAQAGVAAARFLNEAAMERGLQTHKRIEQWWRREADGRLQPNDALSETLWRFAGATRIRPVFVELPVGGLDVGYAGRVDLLGVMPDGSRVIIDWKTGATPPWVGAQLAAYRYAVERMSGATDWQLWAVEISDDRYRVRDYTDDYPLNLRRYLAALIVAQWRAELRQCESQTRS